jgi:hypothetical protein
MNVRLVIIREYDEISNLTHYENKPNPSTSSGHVYPQGSKANPLITMCIETQYEFFSSVHDI